MNLKIVCDIFGNIGHNLRLDGRTPFPVWVDSSLRPPFFMVDNLSSPFFAWLTHHLDFVLEIERTAFLTSDEADRKMNELLVATVLMFCYCRCCCHQTQ